MLPEKMFISNISSDQTLNVSELYILRTLQNSLVCCYAATVLALRRNSEEIQAAERVKACLFSLLQMLQLA